VGKNSRNIHHLIISKLVRIAGGLDEEQNTENHGEDI
jgi:hypothetical protein